jgi:hypothetical protein
VRVIHSLEARPMHVIHSLEARPVRVMHSNGSQGVPQLTATIVNCVATLTDVTNHKLCFQPSTPGITTLKDVTVRDGITTILGVGIPDNGLPEHFKARRSLVSLGAHSRIPLRFVPLFYLKHCRGCDPMMYLSGVHSLIGCPHSA